MDIAEILARKKRVEYQIRDLLTEFEVDTKTVISNTRYDRNEEIGESGVALAVRRKFRVIVTLE